MMRERAAARGQVARGASRPGSVQSHLIAETDKAGLHRAIAAGLVELEQEAFLEQVREKSREQSRQRTTSRQNTKKSCESKARDSLERGGAETRRPIFSKAALKALFRLGSVDSYPHRNYCTNVHKCESNVHVY